MRKLIAIVIVLVWSCTEKKVENDFDEIVHYSITDKVAKEHYSDKQFMNVYWSYDSQKINLTTFEKELLGFGYKKSTLDKVKTMTVNDFVTNKL